MRGYGYADFGDRQSLIDALAMNEQYLKNRPIKIDVSNNSSGGDRRDRGQHRDRMDNRHHDDNGEDRTAGDWRSGGGPPAFRDDDRRDRGYDRYDRGNRYQDDRRSYDRGKDL